MQYYAKVSVGSLNVYMLSRELQTHSKSVLDAISLLV